MEEGNESLRGFQSKFNPRSGSSSSNSIARELTKCRLSQVSLATWVSTALRRAPGMHRCWSALRAEKQGYTQRRSQDPAPAPSTSPPLPQPQQVVPTCAPLHPPSGKPHPATSATWELPLLSLEQLSRNLKLHDTRLEVWSQPHSKADWDGMNIWQQTCGM